MRREGLRRRTGLALGNGLQSASAATTKPVLCTVVHAKVEVVGHRLPPSMSRRVGRMGLSSQP